MEDPQEVQAMADAMAGEVLWHDATSAPGGRGAPDGGPGDAPRSAAPEGLRRAKADVDDGPAHAVGVEPTVLTAARDYLGRGWAVVPLPPRSKAPVLKKWQDLRLTEVELPAYFGAAAHRRGQAPNIGLLTGPASNGLVDVDCDTPEAALAAAMLLPPTDRVSGRPGSPSSHYFYVVDGAVKSTKFQDMDAGALDDPTAGRRDDGRKDDGHRGMLVELRAGGCQTMVAPSILPCGERLRWERAGAPGVALAPDLRRAGAWVAAVALLARHWPAPGSRDDAALALTGLLLRGGWPEDEADGFVRLVARAARDEEWERRAKAASSAERLAAGQTVWGAPALAERLRGDGWATVRRACVWLGLPEPAASRPRLGLVDGGGQGKWGDQGDQHAHPPSLSTLSTLSSLNGSPPADEGHARFEAPGVLLSAVVPVPLRPLWGGRLYLGKITVLDGDPGVGKTLLAMYLAARVSTGRDLFGGEPDQREPAGVVYFSAEDDPGDTLRPRLEAAGGDPSRVRTVTLVRSPDSPADWGGRLPTLRDLGLIADAIESVRARLVIFDPFMAYLGTGTKSHHDQDIRALLGPVGDLAARYQVAILLIRHLNKSMGGPALYRGGGSIGIIGAARSGLLVAADPEESGRYVVASTKNNLGPPPGSLSYRVVAGSDGVPVVSWEGTSPLTADQLLTAAAGELAAGAVQQAQTLLEEWLGAGPQPQQLIQRRAEGYGLSWASVRRAQKALGIRSELRSVPGGGKGGHWVWSLPHAGARGAGGSGPE